MFASPIRCCGHIKNMNGVLAIRTNNIGQIVSSGIGRVRNASGKGTPGDKCCKESTQTEGRRVESWPKTEVSDCCWRTECSREPQPPNNDPYRIKVPDVVVPPLPPSNAKAAIECAKIKGPCTLAKAPDPPPCPPPPRVPFNWTWVAATTTFLAFMGVLYRLYLWRKSTEQQMEKPIWRPRRKLKRPYHDKDLPACVQYLIIGTGTAGWAGYQAIKNLDKAAKVFFITKEDIMPYKRPPMSKHMWWNKEPPDLISLHYIEDMRRQTMYYADCKSFLDPTVFYRKKVGPAVSIASGWCVLRVDADEHVVYVKTMCGEQPIYYERCLLAPGSKPKNLNIFKSAPKGVRDKVQTFRTIRDLEMAFRRVRSSKHVTVLGGGIMGTELAWHLGRMNEVVERDNEDVPPIQFAHVYKDSGILAGIVPAYLGEWGAEKLRCEHVQTYPNTQVYDAFLTKDNRLQLTLSNGSSIITDYVIVALGTEARTEMAEPSFLEVDQVNGGFLVNTELEARTHLYIAGDAASLYSQWKDTRIRMEHYDNAEEQGHIAGANMTGHWTPSNMEPHYELNLGNVLHMEVVGEVGACMPTIGLFKPCGEEAMDTPQALPITKTTGGAKVSAAPAEQPCYKKSEEYKNRYKRGMLFYLRDEIVVGMMFWNVPPVDDRYMAATEMLRARPTYKDINVLAELLGFHSSDCTDYVPPEKRIEEGPCLKKKSRF